MVRRPLARLESGQNVSHVIQKSKHHEIFYVLVYTDGEYWNLNLIRDLGVWFDESLSFTSHIDIVASKALRVFGVAKRFISEVKASALMTQIVQKNITPVVEFCSLIRLFGKVENERKIEKVLHKATRFILRTPMRTDDHRYLCFQRRLAMLKLLTF